MDEDEEENDEEYNDKTETWGSSEEDSQSSNSKAANRFDTEHMSAEEMDDLLTKYNKIHPDRSLGAGVIKYAKMLEEENEKQKNYIEELRAKVWYCEECYDVEEVNTQVLQALLIEKAEELTTMHDDLADKYNDLIDKVREHKEVRRNRSRYRS